MWDKFKSAIFEEDPNAPKAAPAQGQTTTVRAGNITQGVPSMLSPGVNPEFVAAIRKGVFSKNTALTQLITAADALQTIIPDQVTRFKAAFATAGNGRTPNQIIAAVDIHMADVDGEEGRFKVVLDQKLGSEIQQLNQIVQNAEASVTAMAGEIERSQARIAELQKKMGETAQQRNEAATAVTTKTAELEHTTSAFKLAANAVRGELQQIKASIGAALG